MLFVPSFLHDHFLDIYFASAAAYLLHFVLAWYFWPAPGTSRSYPGASLITTTSMAWKCTGDGYHRLTNGLALVHVGIAFVPLLNTVVVYFEIAYAIGFTLVDICRRIMGTVVGKWMRSDSRIDRTSEYPRIDPSL